MKKTHLPVLLLIFTLLLSGCGNSDTATTAEPTPSPDTTEIVSTTNDAAETVTTVSSDYFSNRDFDISYDESKSAFIQLNGDSASCSSNAVKISGSTVTITDEGTYILSGTLNDGMIIVNSEKTDKTQIVLNGVTIHSEACAPIYILQSDKVFITTAKGTTNTLSNGGSFTAIDENNIDAVIFSKEDLTLNGAGTLVISSPAGHGIVSKDSLTLTSGEYDINSSAHALAGKDDVCIADGSFILTSGKDGIHAENDDNTAEGYVYILNGSFNITAEGDGISAASLMTIENGSFSITTGGGSANAASDTSDFWGSYMGGGRHQGGKMNGMQSSFGGRQSSASDSSDSTSIKGIKASSKLIINGGSFTIDSADDAIHSNASVTVNGGSFAIASGDDAFHADETLTITAGTIDISESYEGLEGLHILVSGGDITLTADDDGLNAAGGTDSSGLTGSRDGRFGSSMSSSNGSIRISGGSLQITAYGDGIDANGTLDISGGFITVCGPTQGDTATLDYDISATISGGTFIGTGASTMAQTFSSREQGVVAVSVGNQSAGSLITLTDSSGNTVISYTAPLSFGVVILSTPDIISGQQYSLTVGTASGTVTAS